MYSSMKYTITGYSTAMFSTWYFIEELGLLFDAGDGITSGLLQKARKINYVCLSHADRDHLTGLLQFNQLNARVGYPKIYYPKDCGSIAALADFTKQFDPHALESEWIPVRENEEINIGTSIHVHPIRNGHVPAADGIAKSFSYKVMQTKRKLKNEFRSYSQAELMKVVEIHGKDSITVPVETPVIAYSGDTPVESYERWDNSNILIHEATFLGGEDNVIESPHQHKHSTLYEVLAMVSEITVSTLILGHFSARYSEQEIDDKIRYYCEKLRIKIPVYRVSPGKTYGDILGQDPVNS